MKNRGTQACNSGTASGGGHMGNVCPHCAGVGRTAPHKDNSCYFDPKKLRTEGSGLKNLWTRKDWHTMMTNDSGGKRKK